MNQCMVLVEDKLNWFKKKDILNIKKYMVGEFKNLKN